MKHYMVMQEKMDAVYEEIVALFLKLLLSLHLVYFCKVQNQKLLSKTTECGMIVPKGLTKKGRYWYMYKISPGLCTEL